MSQLWYNRFGIYRGNIDELIEKQIYALLPVPENAVAGYISPRTCHAGRVFATPFSGG